MSSIIGAFDKHSDDGGVCKSLESRPSLVARKVCSDRKCQLLIITADWGPLSDGGCGSTREGSFHE